ncbi:hypothetical protein [Anaerofustis stercorihominis]|uniref:hypothetical protein n=1 Tax=Anaerofustis stercorihominis TaxID=214853 RepID=UPI002671D5A0|nr:hypothetical protein [Anaerofustis stercorihominis]
MNVIKLLIDILEKEFTFPVQKQGSLTDKNAYPESFFTFWLNDTVSEDFFNNNETKVIWDIDLNFYTCNFEKLNEVFNNALDILKINGFSLTGYGYDMPVENPDYDGRGIRLLYIEQL